MPPRKLFVRGFLMLGREYGRHHPEATWLHRDMRKVRASGVTFAPEAGSQRMRDVVNKNVTEEQLLETARQIGTGNPPWRSTSRIRPASWRKLTASASPCSIEPN